MARPKRKTEITTLKMTPEVRDLWERCAQAEHRTLTNMFEVMVRDFAMRTNLPAAPLQQLTQPDTNELTDSGDRPLPKKPSK